MKKLSVIVPVYNVKDYLRRCIDSLISQDYGAIEILLIDDGSTDGTTDICMEYAKRERSIRVIQQKNSGVSSARNRGLSEATGTYITFVDGDDWVESQMFSTLIKVMEEKSVPISIGGYIDDYDGMCKLFFRPQKEMILRDEELMKEFFLQNLFMWSAYDKVYRRDVLYNISFDSRLRIGEDMTFVWEVFLQGKAAAYVPLYQYHYCHRLGSAMQRSFSDSNLSALAVKRRIYEEIDIPHLRKYAECVYIGEMAGVFRSIIAGKAMDFYAVARKLQYEVRKNVAVGVSFLGDNILTKRQRVGLLFMCMPFSWCLLLRSLIVKKSDAVME
jgi:glycosyltransferases involved in cell wall biogenesis